MMFMKNLIIFCILISSFCSLAYADARYPVVLDLSSAETPEIKNNNKPLETPKKPEYNKMDVKKGSISTNSLYEKINKINNPDLSKSFSTKKEKKFKGKTSLGVKYDTDLKFGGKTSQSRTIYTNYNLTDKISLGSSYKTNPLSDMSEQMKGTMSFAPEFKLTEKASLKSVYSKNISGSSSSGEFQFRYNPFKDNRFDMNIGAGQTIYEDSRETSTKVNFGTNFKF